MNLFSRLIGAYTNFINHVALTCIKLSLGNKLNLTGRPQLMRSSRINIWHKNGRITIGESFSMGYNSELYAWSEALNIGDNTSINDNCKIYGSVSIGSNCLLASNIFISSGTHTFARRPALPIKVQDQLDPSSRKIVIEDDCWIGYGVVIMPGVYIGKGAIVGANSVVTKNIYPYTINGGIPCKELKKRLDFSYDGNIINSNNELHWPFFYRGCNYKQFDELNQLKDGIQICDTSVFLLRKGGGRLFHLSGSCDLAVKLTVFLNNEAYTEQHLNKGKIDLQIKLTNQEASCLEFIQLSTEIKDKFDVIVIKFTSAGIAEDLKYKCRVISMGLL